MPAKYRYPDGSEYFGEWSDDGQRHGQGQMSFPDGARYVGQFENGLSSGTGIMTFGDGSRFVRQFTIYTQSQKKRNFFHGFFLWPRVRVM